MRRICRELQRSDAITADRRAAEQEAAADARGEVQGLRSDDSTVVLVAHGPLNETPQRRLAAADQRIAAGRALSLVAAPRTTPFLAGTYVVETVSDALQLADKAAEDRA